MPSAKYAFALSSLRFSKGRTAILFSGIDAAVSVLAGGCGTTVASRRKKIAIPKATADAIKAAVNNNVGQRGGRTATPFCFHLLRLSFSGVCGLPKPFL